jgi:beta-1,4-mannosyltransferase
VPACRYYLVQNPPTLPVLPLLSLVCLVRGGRLLIDFHNFGYTLMRVNGRPSAFVAVAQFLERRFARMATHSFCVS